MTKPGDLRVFLLPAYIYQEDGWDNRTQAPMPRSARHYKQGRPMQQGSLFVVIDVMQGAVFSYTRIFARGVTAFMYTSWIEANTELIK